VDLPELTEPDRATIVKVTFRDLSGEASGVGQVRVQVGVEVAAG